MRMHFSVSVQCLNVLTGPFHIVARRVRLIDSAAENILSMLQEWV